MPSLLVQSTVVTCAPWAFVICKASDPTIAHNGNLSNGMMFPMIETFGKQLYVSVHQDLLAPKHIVRVIGYREKVEWPTRW
jgi:hypothetical protein